MLSATISSSDQSTPGSWNWHPFRPTKGPDSATLDPEEHVMWQAWRKAVIALAIAMIPVYIGLFLAHKQQEERNQRSVPAPNPCEGHGASL